VSFVAFIIEFSSPTFMHVHTVIQKVVIFSVNLYSYNSVIIIDKHYCFVFPIFLLTLWHGYATN